jgi:hypothetical protein
MATIVDTRPPALEDRERRLLQILQRVWTYAITTKSDYAREYADEIAQASSAGFLTTQVAPGYAERHGDTITQGENQKVAAFGRLWKITPEGLEFLYANGDLIAEDEARRYEEDFLND